MPYKILLVTFETVQTCKKSCKTIATSKTGTKISKRMHLLKEIVQSNQKYEKSWEKDERKNWKIKLKTVKVNN